MALNVRGTQNKNVYPPDGLQPRGLSIGAVGAIGPVGAIDGPSLSTSPTIGHASAGQMNTGPEQSGIALTVAAVARCLGVAPSTLRTWDRRHGLGPQSRVSGAHRRYSAEDLARLLIMRRLTAAGNTATEAANVALTADISVATLQQVSDLVRDAVSLDAPQGLRLPLVEASDRRPDQRQHLSSVPDLPESNLSSGKGQAFATDRADTPASSSPPGASASWSSGFATGQGPGMGAMSLSAEELMTDAIALDVERMTARLRAALHVRGVESMWNDVALPALAAISKEWQATGVGVENEHALSEVIIDVLHSERPARTAVRNARPVLLASVEGELHTLALNVLEYALVERGIAAQRLGIGLPSTSLINAVQTTGTPVVFLLAVSETSAVSLVEELGGLQSAPTVVVGGPGWPEGGMPQGAVHARTLAESIREILRALSLR